MATGINSSPTIREGLNLDRNWNTSLQNTLKHVCNTKTTKGQDDARKKHLTASELRQLVKKANSGDVSAIAALSRSYDGKSGIGTGIRTKEEIEAGNRRVWQNTVDGFKTINNIRNKVGNVVLELLSVNDVHRVITGEDPVTGEDASRIEAASSIILDIAALKLGKIAKGLKATKEALRGLDALNDASKVAKAADKAKDASKATKTVGSGIVGNSTSQRSLHARGYRPRLGERTFDGYVKNTVSIDTELKLYTNSPGFNSNNGVIGGQFKRFGSGSHGGLSPHVHQPQRNVAPNGNIYGTVGSKTTNGGVTKPEAKDIKQLYDYTNNGKYRE